VRRRRSFESTSHASLTMKWYYQDGKVTKPHPTLFGYRRRNVFIVFAISIVCLLALIIGLSVGLSLKHKNSRFSSILPSRLILVKASLSQETLVVFIQVT
jgi:hypothetical protein